MHNICSIYAYTGHTFQFISYREDQCILAVLGSLQAQVGLGTRPQVTGLETAATEVRGTLVQLFPGLSQVYRAQFPAIAVPPPQ